MPSYALVIVDNYTGLSITVFEVECIKSDLPFVLPHHLPVKDGYGKDIFDYSRSDLEDVSEVPSLFNGISYNEERIFLLKEIENRSLALPTREFFKGTVSEFLQVKNVHKNEVTILDGEFEGKRGELTVHEKGCQIKLIGGQVIVPEVDQRIVAFFYS